MPYAHHTPFRGRVITLDNGHARAELSSIGASINRFIVGGHSFIVPSPNDAPIIGYRGVIVAPWPGRINAGTYTYEGRDYQLPLSEPERGSALHGLVSFADFAVAEHSDTHAHFVHRPTPIAGYPFPLEIHVIYTLEDTRVHTEVTAINLGHATAPYGVCPHPYLVAGPTPMDQWRVYMDAKEFLILDERLLPVSRARVSEHPQFNLSDGAPIAQRAIDTAYTAFTHGTVRVECPRGSSVSMNFDPDVSPWVVVFTADNPDPQQHRVGLAIEPMTCPPNAFASGQGLIHLKAGARHTVHWSITAHASSSATGGS